MKRIYWTSAGLLALVAMSSLGCEGSSKDDTDTTDTITEDLKPLLEVSVNKVIIPTYQDMLEKVTALADCAEQLASAPTDEQLLACQESWVAARIPWEQSEGFLFGPVSNQGLDPAMDSWPVDSVQLEALMSSDVVLTAETIQANLGGGLKGFHTIEYLLWGDKHSSTVAVLAASPRKLSYLVELTKALKNDTQTLVDSWTSESDGYGQRFIASGSSGAVYSRQTDAALELGGALSGIADEVGNGKIAEPYKAEDPNLVESQFSYNSIDDFVDNLRSIRNVYLGSLDGTVAEHSFSAVIAKSWPKDDAAIQAAINQAIEKVSAIEADDEPFRDAISNPKKAAVIEAAMAAMTELYEVLKGKLESKFGS